MKANVAIMILVNFILISGCSGVNKSVASLDCSKIEPSIDYVGSLLTEEEFVRLMEISTFDPTFSDETLKTVLGPERIEKMEEDNKVKLWLDCLDKS